MPRKINVEARQAVNELQNPSILDQVSRIIANVDDADRVIASLEAWQASLNPKTYEKIEPWSLEPRDDGSTCGVPRTGDSDSPGTG
jgi:hypothetical protein